MGVSYYIRRLVSDETTRQVASAAEDGDTISIPASAAAIAKKFPGSTFSEEEIRNQLFNGAAAAGVDVELRRPSEPHKFPRVSDPSAFIGFFRKLKGLGQRRRP